LLTPDVRRLPSGYILDTGPLLIYTFGAWQHGRYLPAVQADIPEIDRVAVVLRELVARTTRIVVTPQIITEFQALSRIRANIDTAGTVQFLTFCRDFLVRLSERFTPMEDLLRLKDRENLWRLSFTDSSVIMASRYTGLPVLTVDAELRSRSQELGVEVYHLYYDFYLNAL
jgi:rRNA-processing protein FCF1